MEDAVLSRYAIAFRDSAVAVAVIDSASRNLLYSNNAFLRFFKSLQVVAGGNVFADVAALSEALAVASAGGTMVAHDCLHTNARYEFSPLLQAGAPAAWLQCMVTPLAGPLLGLAGQASSDAPAAVLLNEGYRRILDDFPHNVWLCTVKGELFWTNRTSNLFTYGQPEFHDADNTRYIAKIHPDDLTGAGVALAKAMSLGRMDAPHRYRLRDHAGVYHWFQFSMAPVRDGLGATLYWVGTSVNIQAFHDAEMGANARIEQLRQRSMAHEQRALEAQRLQAQQHKMELVSHLAGGVAHDLNNLLHVMGINIELMQAQPQQQALLPYLRVLDGCLKKAGRLSTQLAGFSGRLPQNAVALEPQALVDDIQELLAKAVGAEVSFRLQIEPGLQPLFADKSYLENALINLAINARDAMDGRGSMVLRVAPHSRPDQNGHLAEYVMFEVEDSGAGMAPELQARVFDPFFSTKGSGKGSGLGLTMVKTFVENSGGHVGIESTPGVGTRVAMYLPVSLVPVENAKEANAAIVPGVGRILLVEDDDSVREAMNRILNQLGYDTIPSFSSDHAVTLLQGGMKPDLIISDIRMPGRLNVHDLIATVEAGSRTPIIFATGYSADVVIREGLVNDRYPVLFKPFSAAEISARIQIALGNHAQDADAEVPATTPLAG